MLLTRLAEAATIISLIVILYSFLESTNRLPRILPKGIARAIVIPLVACLIAAAILVGSWRLSELETRLDAMKSQQTLSASNARPMYLKGWGREGPVCGGVVDGAMLANFRDTHSVALLCGMVDPAVDKFEDKRITVSGPFTIVAGDIPIEMPHSQEMASALEKARAEMTKRANIPKGTLVAVFQQTWYEPILLPKGTNPAEIRRLSDVPRHGGKILNAMPSS